LAEQGLKPYVKLASTLVLIGMGLFSLEQFGLTRLEGPTHSIHLDSTLLSIMVLLPIVLVAAGALVFVFGKMRRL
jgi:heme/copper-type cytochrome/quinol oxidase subunit 2